MAMISPQCLENLLEMGKWMGLAEQNMERTAQGTVGFLTPLPNAEVLAGYNLTEIEGIRKRILQDCPQRAESDLSPVTPDSPWADTPPHYDFQLTLGSIQKLWADRDHVVAMLQMKVLEEALMDWLDNIAFHDPSRHANLAATGESR